MHITIENFRCLRGPITYEFNEGNLLLLDAPSGAGKSTILEAIYWCLYGSMRDVYPFSISKSTTRYSRVSLYVDGVTVTRSKPPDKIKIEEPGSVHENESAQARIEMIFGERDVWLATSYMRQGTEHPLISRSATEKFNLLHNLTFGCHADEHETPEYYLNMINMKIKDITDEYTRAEGVNDYMKQRFNELKDKTEKAQEIWGDRSLSEVETLRDELDIELDELSGMELKRNNHLKLYGRRMNMEESVVLAEDELSQLEVEVSQLKPIDKSVFTEMEDLMKNLRARQELQQKIHRLKILDYIIELTDDERENLKHNCLTINKCRQELKLTGVNVKKLREQAEAILDVQEQWNLYKSDESTKRKAHEDYCIKLERDHAERKVNSMQVQLHNSKVKTYYEDLERYNKYLEIKQKRDDLLKQARAIKPKDYIVSDLINDKIKQTRRELETLVCPECKSGLSLKGDNLVSVNDEATRIRLEQDLNILIEEKRKAQDYELLVSEGESLNPVKCEKPDGKDIEGKIGYKDEINIEPLDIPKYTPSEPPRGRMCSNDEIKLLEQLLEATRDFPDYSVSVLLSSLNSFPEYERLSEELVNFKSLKPGTCLETLITEYNRLKKLDETHKNLTMRHEMAVKNLQKLKRQLDNIPHTSFDEHAYQMKKKAIAKMEEILKNGEEIINLENERDRLVKSNEKLVTLKKIQTDAYKLRNIIEDISIQAMQFSIASLESSTNNILKNLFDDSLIIRINTTKETKSAKNARPKFVVNMTLNYKNFEYSSLSSLSGGEMNRLNLALTLAMSNISGSKMLLLDEVLNTLDTEMKDRALQVIKMQTEGKTVVNVCHDSVAGLYSDVISV